MRSKSPGGVLTVQAIAGSYVVLLGINIDDSKRKGLLGFAIQRTQGGKSHWLQNLKVFKDNDHGAATDRGSDKNPFQSFVWGDYGAQPNTEYTYRIVAKYGDSGSLEDGPSATVTVSTVDEDGGEHAVYFNRGVAGSQAYARKFQNAAPNSFLPDRKAYVWLSRGLEEAMLGFIGQASGPGFGLRAAVYEFTWNRTLEGFKAAAATGADVQIVYDGQPSPGDEDSKAIAAAGIGALVKPRLNGAAIHHNKFVILLEDGKPTQVWTGSTNITEGGIFGHSNVGHIVRDPAVAQAYLEYWTRLHNDEPGASLRSSNHDENPAPPVGAPDEGVGQIFSPRPDVSVLAWYAKLAEAATSGLFLTAPFGVNKLLAQVYEEPRDFLRYILLNKNDGTSDVINRTQNDQVTAGATLGKDEYGNWLPEKLTGLNGFVPYVHTKYMLIDPLGDDPIVITGSANFSDASIHANDENMLIIRGDQHVADIYLTEFMRLFTHLYFRAHIAKATGANQDAGFLKESDAWTQEYFTEGSPKQKERLYFNGAAATVAVP